MNPIKKIIKRSYFLARPNKINPIYYLRIYNEGKSILRLKKHYNELFKLITLLTGKSNSTGCEFSDYLELFLKIKSLKPKYILECGSGISSAVIAYALKKNNTDFKFISLEENKKYLNEIQQIIPHELKKVINFKLTKRCEKRFGKYIGCYYKEIPKYNYDFIFIDGPSIQKNPNSPKCFNCDLINIINYLPKKHKIYAILDQRIRTYLILKELIKNGKFKYHPIKKIATIEIEI